VIRAGIIKRDRTIAAEGKIRRLMQEFEELTDRCLPRDRLVKIF
jgi:hypothetical protein